MWAAACVPFDLLQDCCAGGYCASPDTNDFDLPRNGIERLVPYFDGVMPMRLYDFDDRPRVLREICAVLRDCLYPSGGCAGEHEELDSGSPAAPYGSALCPPDPVYDTDCVPTELPDD